MDRIQATISMTFITFRRCFTFLFFIFIFLSSTACEKSEKGLQQILSENFLSKQAAVPQKKGTKIRPSKEDRTSQQNSITKCPESASLYGKPFPAGISQWCAYKDDEGRQVRHGEYREWQKNGELRVLAFYEDGELEGKFREWHGGRVQKEDSNYRDGLREGVTKLWDKKGNLIEETEYHEGEKNGLSAQYTSKGFLKFKGPLKQGLEEGIWEFYNSRGAIREKTEFSKGVRHGKTKEFSNKGRLRAQGYYNRGSKIGHWIYFRPQAQSKKMEGNFLNNEKHGRWVDYSKNGSPVRYTFYDKGKKLDSYKAENRIGNGHGAKSFGARDILGDEPPIPQRGISPKQKKSKRKGEKTKKGLDPDGWNPL